MERDFTDRILGAIQSLWALAFMAFGIYAIVRSF